MELVFIDEEFDLVGSVVPRSKGTTHLTDVIRAIEERTGMADKYASAKQWDKEATMEMGFIWEDVLSHVMRERLGVRPGEVELDGIVGSPDGIGEDPKGEVPIVIEEYKLTWMSMRKDPLTIWRWMVQIMGYCKMVNTNVAVMRILYVMGDYRGSGPQRRTVRIKYMDEEIERNWTMIKEHASLI